MTMHFVLALAALVLVAISAADAAAQGRPAYYCDPLHVYSPPYTGNCPVPWRPVAPPVAPQPYGATPPASQGPIQLVPQAARPNFPALGDGLDDWCKTAELPSSIAICSDRDLRVLVLERQRAYDEAKARLNPDQQKVLLADQNGWVRSYARACGLGSDPPSLPLAASIKTCMAEAGRERIAHLKDYGGASAVPGTGWTSAYEAILRDWFQTHKPIYPKNAFEHREQGRGVLRIRVDRTGRVLDYSITQSTGFADLDAAVVEAVQGATLPSFPTGMANSEVEASIPFSFTPTKVSPAPQLDFVTMVGETGCESPHSDEKKADIFSSKYKDKPVVATGLIDSLKEDVIGLRVMPNTLTFDVRIELKDDKAGYNLIKGSQVTVRFTVYSAGGCFLPYFANGGVIVSQ